MIFKSHSIKLVILALAILFPAQGCIWGSVEYDRTLTKDVINKIEPGKTTRKNILKWFGPPEVLAKKDDKVSIPFLDNESKGVKIREVDSTIFFEKFSEKHSISEHYVVYYYLNEGEDINGFSIPIPGLTFVSVPATLEVYNSANCGF